MAKLKNQIAQSIPKIRNIYILLSVIVLVVFGNTIQNGYNMDDDLVTQQHRYTSKGFAGIKDIISNSYYSNNSDIVFGYRPITHITFAIEHQIFGENASMSHLINLILYLVSVCLFFHLLLKWFGPTQFWIPAIAASVFAVHPIHTEVVASIKNRDEILALLLAITSAISLFSYYENKKWYNYLFFLLLFPLALLSKKSVYPLIVVLPLITYLVNPISIKRIAMAFFIVAIPASYIVADFLWVQFISIYSITSLLFIVGISFIYLRQQPSLLSKCKQLLKHTSIYLVLASLLSISGFYLNESIFHAMAILIALGINYQDKQASSYFLIVLNTILSWQYLDPEAASITVVYAVYLGFKQVKAETKDWKSIITIFIAILSFIFIKEGIAAILIFIQILVFFFLNQKNPIYGLLLILVSIVVSFISFNIPIYQYILLLISLMYVVKQYKDNINEYLTNYMLIIVLSITPLFTSIYHHRTNSQLIDHTISAFKPSDASEIQRTIQKNVITSNLKEGRTLNYIENTLVATHTPVEKLATGIVTLGEYLRLMVFPYELSFYYGYAKIKTAHPADFLVWFSLLLHLLLLVLLLKLGYKNKAFIGGLLWYFTSIFIFSNYIELVAGMVGERLAYTASAGLCIAFAALIISVKPILSFKKPSYVEYLLILILLVFGTRSALRNNEWENPITLMESDITHLENSAQANHLLAINLLYTAQIENIPTKSAIAIEKAKMHLEKSIEIYPYFFNTHYELAKVYINESNWLKAKQKLSDALALDSTNLFVLEAITKVCFELNQAEETELYANRYLSYIPQNENIHELLAFIMFTNKQYEKARSYARRGLNYFPSGANLLPLLKDIETKISEQVNTN